LGGCGGVSNPTIWAGNDEFLIYWCLLCLPAILFTALTWFGVLMAPAVTAPTISLERSRGTWDMLRVTPMPDRDILLAKLFGGLARLRIWRLLLALSLLQGLIIAFGAAMASEGLVLTGIAVGLTSIIRPWLEVGFAAFVGMFASMWVRSATMALSASYIAVVAMKLFNGSLTWTAVLGLMNQNEAILWASSVGPTAVYAVAVVGLWWGISWRAERMNEE
jgi:ABC-type transport system involved in multi-copper enzyme maturation permease subunit